MTKLLFTIWALILNTLGISIFRTCFANAMEDEDGEALLTGPPITSFFFASGIYTIIVTTSLFPTTFRKPRAYFICIYEFLATAFFLEFSIACIWTPIDVLILTTLPKAICNILTEMNLAEAAEIITMSKVPMATISCLLAFGFFILALHVTKSLDFTILIDCGWGFFFDYAKERLFQRILNELPKMNFQKTARCRGRKKKRSKGRHRSCDCD